MTVSALRRSRAGWFFLIVLLVVPRVVDPTADPWPDLCWGSGIWTDEGFYTHAAREAVLFGGLGDEFDNRILSPLLDAVHRALFRTWGVGLTTARLPSIVAGLLSLPLFHIAMRRRFGPRVAGWGLLFFGLEVSWLFTNRVGLMESTGVLVLVTAFLAWSVATPAGWFAAGALAAGVVAVKTNFLLFLPLPVVLALWRTWRGDRRALRETGWFLGGAFCAAAAYLLWWGLPHGAEIVRMNNFYRTRQSQPRSFAQLLWMIRRGLVGYHFGLLQRLETRTPVLTSLALAGLSWSSFVGLRPGARRFHCRPRPRREAERLLVLWLAAGLGFLLVSRYAPARYFLVFHPAMAGAAAIALDRMPAWLRMVRRGTLEPRWLALPAIPLGFHWVQPAAMASAFRPAAVAVGIAAGTALFAWASRWLPVAARRVHPERCRVVIAGLFLVGSVGQIAAWWATRRHDNVALSRRLARDVGPGGVVVGDWAPNLCLENDLRAIPSFRGLANDARPVERFRADAVLVARTPVPMAFWRELAPTVVRDANRIATYPYHGYLLDLYRVPGGRR